MNNRPPGAAEAHEQLRQARAHAGRGEPGIAAETCRRALLLAPAEYALRSALCDELLDARVKGGAEDLIAEDLAALWAEPAVRAACGRKLFNDARIRAACDPGRTALARALHSFAERHANDAAVNKVLSEDEIGRDARTTLLPLWFHFILTNVCNLNCVMCTRIAGARQTLPAAVFEKLWPYFPYINYLEWEGGEVFMVDYFAALLERLGAAFPHITHLVTTNGLLIDRPRAELLARHGVRLRFSVDSPVRETYEEVRSGARYDDLCASLALANEAYGGGQKPFALQATVLGRTVAELPRFPEFCARHGIPELKLKRLAGVPSEEVADAGFLAGMLGETAREAERLGIRFSHPFGGGELPAPAGPPPVCVKPWRTLAVFFDGTVKPGCECGPAAGNLLDQDLADIWNGEGMRAYRERFTGKTASGPCAGECARPVI